MTLTEDQVIAAFDAAPEMVRESISSTDTITTIAGLAKTYGLHIDVIGTLAELNRNVMLGIISPAEFLGELVLAGIDAATTRKIIGELNEKIYAPLQKQMRESGPAQAPMSAPRPPVQPPIQVAQEPAVVLPPSPARTAPAPTNLPGAEDLLPASDPALHSILSTPPPVPPPVSVQLPAPAPQPVYRPTPTPVAIPAPPQTPRPAPAATPIYSVELNKPGMPDTKQGIAPQASVMWQTPVPPAWQGRQAAPAIPLMTEPPEKPSPRTMEGDMQLAAQKASQPQAAQVPQPVYQPVMPPPAPVTVAQPTFVSTSSAFSTVHTAPERPQESYVPPPRTISIAPVKIGAGDPYREPIDASEL